MNFLLNKSVAPIIAGMSAFVLAVVKILIGFYSGSMSVLASAIDSIVDFVISILNYFAISKASDNPDDKFNYGYGKIESLMAIIEGFVIIAIGCVMFYFNFEKIITDKYEIKTDIAIYIMLFSVFITGILILYLQIVYKKTNSLVIKADTLHYKTDFFTNLGIIIALVLVKISGFVVIDAIVGILISIYIVYSAITLMKESFHILIDGALDEKIITDIQNYIKTYDQITSYHCIRSRMSAGICFFSAHLVFNNTITLLEAHNIGNSIEDYIKDKYLNYKWIIDLHFDPEDDFDEYNEIFKER